MEKIPKSHQVVIDLLDTMRKYTNEHKDDMMGMFNIRRDDKVFVATLGAYRSGDAFVWFVDSTEYFLYAFVNENEGIKHIIQFPIERQEEFVKALKEVQQELKDRGNPVTIRRL
jgi:hypothetical protein